MHTCGRDWGATEGSLKLQLCFLSKQIARGWQAGLHGRGWGTRTNYLAGPWLGLEILLAHGTASFFWRKKKKRATPVSPKRTPQAQGRIQPLPAPPRGSPLHPPQSSFPLPLLKSPWFETSSLLHQPLSFLLSTFTFSGFYIVPLFLLYQLLLPFPHLTDFLLQVSFASLLPFPSLHKLQSYRGLICSIPAKGLSCFLPLQKEKNPHLPRPSQACRIKYNYPQHRRSIWELCADLCPTPRSAVLDLSWRLRLSYFNVCQLVTVTSSAAFAGVLYPPLQVWLMTSLHSAEHTVLFFFLKKINLIFFF